MSSVTIVTGNTSKFEQMQAALAEHDIAVERRDADIDELQTLDHEAVIKDKVRKAFEVIGAPVLVDDSGFYFPAYNKFPGVYAKYMFKALGHEGLFKLTQPGDKIEARTYAGYLEPGMEEPQIFTGVYEGVVTDEFDWGLMEMPYAPMMVPHDSPDGRNMADMTHEQRRNDHRHQALSAFATWYTSR